MRNTAHNISVLMDLERDGITATLLVAESLMTFLLVFTVPTATVQFGLPLTPARLFGVQPDRVGLVAATATTRVIQPTNLRP